MRGDQTVGWGTSLAYGIAGAVIVGFPSFLAGFLSPLFLAPPASQAPLIGIFITGPVGAVIGFMAGILYLQLRPPKR
jgi:hypothetical protein